MKTTYRILHISNNQAYTDKSGKHLNPLTRGMREAGHQVYDYPSELLHAHTDRPEILSQRIFDAVVSVKPSFVFAQCGPETFPVEAVRMIIEKIGIPIFFWTGDVRNSNSIWEVYSHSGAIVLFSNKTDVHKLMDKGLRADFLQISFDETEYFKNHELNPVFENDIVFLGNNYISRKDLNFPLSSYRKTMCLELTKEFGDHFTVYGSGWDANGGLLSMERIKIGSKATTNEQERLLYQAHAICINLSHFHYDRYSSDRLFRIMASGGFCLTHKYPELEKEFDEGIHLDTWETIAELKNKIKYWLDPANKERRLQIAKAGYDLVHSKYTWKNRFMQMTDIINNQKLNVMQKNDEWVKNLQTTNPEKHYSQNGEEGIIGQIMNVIGAENKTYVDLGAGDGKYLSNTRFFDEQGWKGLKVDADPRGAEDVFKSFITVENVVQIMKDFEVLENFDFLSIDLDGNDGYILEAILAGGYRPKLIVAEFNGTIPKDKSVIIEYNSEHAWAEDDYYGFSFEAAKNIAIRNGYRVIAQNADTNVYMVRADLLANPDADFGVTYTPQQYHKHNPNGKWIEVPVGKDLITEKSVSPAPETASEQPATQPAAENAPAVENPATSDGLPAEGVVDTIIATTTAAPASEATPPAEEKKAEVKDELDIFATPNEALSANPEIGNIQETKSLSADEINAIKRKYGPGYKPKNFFEEQEMRSAGML